MATSRPFAYNPSRTPIPGTEQVGDLAIAIEEQYYSEGIGGVRWWMGPNEDPGYIICYPFSAGTKPSPDGNIANIGFKRSQFKTEESFVSMSNAFAAGQATFANGTEAYLWLNLNGYWTSYIPLTPTLTPTSTPTPTITPTITPSGGDQVLINPIITENDDYIDVGNESYLMFVDPSTPEVSPSPTPTETVTPTPTLTSTETITPTPSATSSETTTPTPTETLTPTPTESTTPTPTPTETQIVPTPTNTQTPTSSNVSLTPTPTSTPSYKSWLITQCGDPCDTGTCACNSSSTLTVYTLPGVTSLVTPGVTVYTDSLLTTTWNGYYYYPDSDEVWLFTNGVTNIFNSCAIGLDPCISVSPTPTPTITITPTLTSTPTNTPTPSVTPQPVTGYSFNLVALPYNFPSSGNSIMNGPGGASSGSTDMNALSISGRGFYLNSIDSDSVDRTSYFSSFTGQNVTITFTQTGNTAIYSGDTNSFKFWSITTPSPATGFVFGTGIGVPPSGTPSGTAILIQSATTQYTIGLPVLVSLVTS